MTRIGTLVTKSLTVLDSTDENRFFEGYLTVEMKDKQGEITVVDELYKVLPIWVDRGAPITDTHSNRVIGKGINFAKTTVEADGVTYPAIKITGKIHKNYELDTDIWEKIKSGEYKGLSFGGATKANRVPKVMKDGDIAYALTDLEHYEVAVCRDPAVPLALITDYNTLAKATVPSEPRGDGKEVIKCDKFGCYVTKSEGKDEPEYHDESLIKGGEDWSNADIIPATVTNTVSQSTQTAKPVKMDKKVGVPESEGGLKMNVTPLEGGIKPPSETNKEFPAGTGGGVRAHIDDASNQDSPKDQTAQVSEKIERIHKSDVNKVIGAILAGAQRIEKKDSWDKEERRSGFKERMQRTVHAASIHGDEEQQALGTKQGKDEERAISGGKVAPSRTVTISGDGKKVKNPKHEVMIDLLHELKALSESTKSALGALGWGKLNRDGSKQKLRKKQPSLDDFTEEKKKFGHTTEEGNIQLGNPSIPKELKEKLISSLGAQNKENIATTDTKRVDKSNYCPSCGQKRTEQSKRDYPETDKPHALCPSCDQKKRIAERDAKDDAKMEGIVSGIHRDLSASGQKVTRFSSGKAPKTYNS